jgi:ATP-binding cassette subfamily B protein
MTSNTDGLLALYKRIFLQVRPYWPHIIAVQFTGMLAAPINLLLPVPLKIVVDSVLGAESPPAFLNYLVPTEFTTSGQVLLMVAVGLLLAFTGLNALQQAISWLLSTYTGENITFRFQSQLFERAQRLSLLYHEAEGVSDASYRIQNDAPALQWIAVWSIVPFASALLTLVGIGYVMMQLSVELALVALAISPILIVLTSMYGRRIRLQWERVKDVESSTLSIIQEVLGAIRVVKGFGQERRETMRFEDSASISSQERIRVMITEGTLTALIILTLGVGTAAVLLIGAWQVQAGEITLGVLLLMMSYLAQLYGPLHLMGKQIAAQHGMLVSARRAFSLFDRAPGVAERAGARPLRRAKGAIEFRNVSFGYLPDRPVLHDISLSIPPGARVGICGATGSGKSTLVSLANRFFDPTSGEILLDGIDIRDYRLEDLAAQFSIVPQEPVLFSQTIAQNIAYARPTATRREIIEAARYAGIHDLIAGLPQGLDTVIGNRGLTVSGGERQRIALARAFLKDAPLLIFDEPTSSVDIETEAAIMKALDRLTHGRTTLIIAHRLTTLDGCDITIQLDQGRLVAIQSRLANEPVRW